MNHGASEIEWDICQLLVCAQEFDQLDRNISTIKKNTRALLIASKDVVLEVSTDKTSYGRFPVLRFIWRHIFCTLNQEKY
jgi:hypothetical protein